MNKNSHQTTKDDHNRIVNLKWLNIIKKSNDVFLYFYLFALAAVLFYFNYIYDWMRTVDFIISSILMLVLCTVAPLVFLTKTYAIVLSLPFLIFTNKDPKFTLPLGSFAAILTSGVAPFYFLSAADYEHTLTISIAAMTSHLTLVTYLVISDYIDNKIKAIETTKTFNG